MEYYKGIIFKVLSYQLENLEEINEFIDSSKPPELNKGEINNLNWPMTNNEIKTIIEKPFD